MLYYITMDLQPAIKCLPRWGFFGLLQYLNNKYNIIIFHNKAQLMAQWLYDWLFGWMWWGQAHIPPPLACSYN
jgi:hypothetical protein